MTYPLAEKLTSPHESAIAEFRPHLRERDLAGFDAACDTYRQCRKPDRGPGPYLVDSFTVTQTNDLHRAIESLLSYADKN
jgi:hypothetical protein